MPKTTPDFDPESYAPVAARVELFYERYPTGRILTELVQHNEREIVFRSSALPVPPLGGLMKKVGHLMRLVLPQ